MDFDPTRSLAFLLSLAAVPMAGCPASSDGTGTATDGTTGDTTSTGPTTEPTTATPTTNDTMTMTADSTGEPTTATTTDPSTDPTTDGTTTDPSGTETTEGTTEDPSGTTVVDETTTETTETTDATDDTTTTGGDATLCEQAAAHLVECVPQYAALEDYIAAYCNSSLADYAAISRECGAAGEEYFACLAEAPCQDLQGDNPCPEEGAAIGAVCGMDGGPQ